MTVNYLGDRRIVKDLRTGVLRRNNQRVIGRGDIKALGDHVWDCYIADAEGKLRPVPPTLSFDRVAIK